MEKFGEMEQGNEFAVHEISTALKERIDIETIPHFKSVMERASRSFEQALATEDKEEQKEYLASMAQCENYLGEKYRGTREERAYIAALNKGIEYLEGVTSRQ